MSLARDIYLALNANGADLGNASLRIIEDVIEKSPLKRLVTDAKKYLESLKG